MAWRAVWVKLLTQQTFTEQWRIKWWVRQDAGSWGNPGWWWGDSACLLLGASGWMAAPAAAPLGLPLPLCWAHTFGGFLPALGGVLLLAVRCKTPPAVTWTSRMFYHPGWVFLRTSLWFEVFLPEVPSSSLLFHRSQTCLSLWNLFSPSLAPSPYSFTGLSLVNPLHTQSCLLFGGPRPTQPGLEM